MLPKAAPLLRDTAQVGTEPLGSPTGWKFQVCCSVPPSGPALPTPAELPTAPPIRFEREAYTFSGYDLEDLVARLPEDVRTVALVGHNPAVEELVEGLTGQWVPMPTSALAVIDISGPTWGAGAGVLRWAGRPADLS